jgi:hypothetical protein
VEDHSTAVAVIRPKEKDLDYSEGKQAELGDGDRKAKAGVVQLESMEEIRKNSWCWVEELLTRKHNEQVAPHQIWNPRDVCGRLHAKKDWVQSHSQTSCCDAAKAISAVIKASAGIFRRTSDENGRQDWPDEEHVEWGQKNQAHRRYRVTIASASTAGHFQGEPVI